MSGQLIFGFLPWTTCNAVYAIHGDAGAGYAVIVFIFIATAFLSSAWTGILTGYTMECMSYAVRSKIIVTQNLLVQASITGFNYLNPVALQNIGWKYYICIDVIIVIAIITVYFTYPETSKITLEGVSTIFDGKQAVRNVFLEEQIVMEGVAKRESGDKAVTVERKEEGVQV